VPTTALLEKLADLRVEKDALKADIASKQARLKEINRLLRKMEKPGLPKVTKASPVEDLILPARTYQMLHADNILTIGELIERTERDLLRVPGLGRKVLNEIKEALEEHGLHLKPKLVK
jgi:DNA-directed RNA polymerase alpha subunit